MSMNEAWDVDIRCIENELIGGVKMRRMVDGWEDGRDVGRRLEAWGVFLALYARPSLSHRDDKPRFKRPVEPE